MRAIRYFQVDAFTSELFRGNPAGVCLLEDEWLSDGLLQRIAFENNLSETAFILQRGKDWTLRWFTPAIEVDLCGHATLAAAFVIFTQLAWAEEIIRFESKSRGLNVIREGAHYVLDFPARPGAPAEAPRELIEGLGAEPREVYKARDWMCVFDKESDVRAIKPRFDLLARVREFVIVTAPGHDVDFVSRFFAPTAGINEDPVTGSAHCTLIPFWAERLKKRNLRARQISRRTGEIFCEHRGERVGIGGHAVLYSSGQLHV